MNYFRELCKWTRGNGANYEVGIRHGTNLNIRKGETYEVQLIVESTISHEDAAMKLCYILGIKEETE